MQKIHLSPDAVDNAVHQFHEYARIFRHDQVLIVRGAVTQVVTQFHVCRHGVAQHGQFGKYLLFVVRGSMRKVILEGQHFLADVILYAQVFMGDLVQDPVQGIQQ